MNDRVRAILLGIGLAVAPLLLLDLGGTLTSAVSRDPDETSVWWPVACYLAAGVLVAMGVGMARRDRLLAVAAAVVVIALTLPLVPSGLTRWLAGLPIPSLGDRAGIAALLVVAGAYVYAAVRGPQA